MPDPNIMIPAIIESGVETDGGAFNVREGNHSVDMAAAYVIRPSLQPLATLTGDSRDVDVSTGWRWLAGQASYGNGLLDTLEHRKQFKLNGVKSWTAGAHTVTALVIGYYGESRVPGLVPIDVPGLHDTIDPRQKDQTHTGEAAVNDVWRLGKDSEVAAVEFFSNIQSSAVFRLRGWADPAERISNREWRKCHLCAEVQSGHFTFMAGVDYLREAPRADRRSGSLQIDESECVWAVRESYGE